MAAIGNFSNDNVDTFNPRNHYVGVRLQQGVPLLDRDWNELEDIRRHFERRMRELNIGAGVPDADGFAIGPPATPTDNDVLIAAGSCSIGGRDVSNEQAVLFSKQGELRPLPPAPPAGDTLVVFLESWVERIDEKADGAAALANEQDIGMVTCLRDRLRWRVGAAASGAAPASAYVLAEIKRPAAPADQVHIAADQITDRRRVNLNLARAVDRIGELERRLTALEIEVRGMPARFGTATFDRPYVFA